MLSLLRQEKGFYRGALALMLPMIVQNLVNSLMGIIDTFMVGGLGETSLAAVTVANTPFFVVTVACFGIQSGAAVLVAQYHGKENQQAINRVLGVGLYISAAFTAVVALISFFFSREIMGLFTNNRDLIGPGAQFIRWIGFAYFFNSISALYFSVLRSMSRPLLGTLVFSASSVLLVLLDWLLIYGYFGFPKLGVAGAAVASVICRVLEVVVVCCYAGRSRHLKLYPKLILRPGGIITRDFIKFSLPVVLNELLWSSAVSAYYVIMGHMDNNTPILAAYTIVGNIDRLTSVALFAVGNAAAVIIGREIGAGRGDSAFGKAVSLVAVAIAFGLGTSVLMLAVRFFAVKSLIFPLLGTSAEAQVFVLTILIIFSCAMPFRAINHCCIVGVLRGGGDVRFGLFVDTAAMYLICIPAAIVLGLVLRLDFRIVYLCFIADEFIKAFFCAWRLLSKKWIHLVARDRIELT